jgi:iron-sulfur cluster repair protein YtfE (RIC family)
MQHHRKEVKCMKRHPTLRKFSDDHHGGLVQARRLRRVRAGESESREVARSFLPFWDKDASPHFREEEEVLLPVYARHGGDLGAEPIQEMVADHARLRGLVMTLIEEDRSGDVSTDTLRKIGERLEAHIRLEERRVFPLVEAALPEEGLEQVGTRLATG